MRSDSALERHLRIGAISAGVGSILFTMLGLADIATDLPHQLVAWAWPSTVLFCALPIALIPLAIWASIDAVLFVARAHTVVAGLTIVAWVPFSTSPIPHHGAPWVLNMFGVIVAVATVAWPGRIVWPSLVALAGAGTVVRFIGFGNTHLVLALEDGLSMLEAGVVIGALLQVTLAAGRAQDRALAAALREARTAAEAESKARQRTRFAALVHDDVITTLLVAAHTRESDPAIARSAERALARLDDFLSARTEDLALDTDLFEIEVRAAVTDIVDGVAFDGSFSALDGEVPGDVALAITGALGEAARNSVRHAGTARIARRLRMDATPTSLTVQFVDDGTGFDVSRVSPDRFGIRSSIRDRLASVGGRATVSSAPGEGTRVSLEWIRQ